MRTYDLKPGFWFLLGIVFTLLFYGQHVPTLLWVGGIGLLVITLAMSGNLVTINELAKLDSDRMKFEARQRVVQQLIDKDNKRP